MKCVCKFNKNRDLQQVDQFGFVDINKSVLEGFVPNDLGDPAIGYDAPEVDPESIVGKPSDAFAAMRMQDSLASGIRKDVQKKQSKFNTEN